MPKAQIRWPHDDEFNNLSALVQQLHPLLEGAFGVVDGLNLPVQVSADDDVENATYNGWLHGHFISNIFAFSPQGSSLSLPSSTEFSG